MKSTRFIAGIVVVATSVVAVGAYAQSEAKAQGHGAGSGMHGKKMSFEVLDTDGNGEITLEELQSRSKDRFIEIDTNQDGMLSAEELEAHAQKQTSERVAMMIERHDTDGDSLLTIEEMPGAGRGEAMFARIDPNGDGIITQEEFEQAKSQRKGHGKKHNKDN
ncbi:MAG: EF-hand domain-containing protein [Rhodobacteraceae bacterium]|nr:EF-hand domain-containing protein [Paracoccaceae bacterium]